MNIKNFYPFFLLSMKMNKKILSFDKQHINENEFHKNKKPIIIDKVEIRRTALSQKYLYSTKGSFKYFIGYINETDAFPVPSCIKLPQINGYLKYFDSNNRCINLLDHDEELLRKYDEI